MNSVKSLNNEKLEGEFTQFALEIHFLIVQKHKSKLHGVILTTKLISIAVCISQLIIASSIKACLKCRKSNNSTEGSEVGWFRIPSFKRQ